MEKQRNNYKIGLYLDRAMQRKIISVAKLYCKPEEGDLTETREEIRRIFMYFCAVFLLVSVNLFSYRILF